LLPAISSGVARASGDVENSSESFDSAAVWLPDPVESLDAPERLHEPGDAARLRLMVMTGRGGTTSAARRLWWNSRRFDAALSMDAAARADAVEGAVLARAGAFAFGGGALSLAEHGMEGEVAGLVRRTRSLGAEGTGVAGAAGRPPGRVATGAAADLMGALVNWRDRVSLAGGSRRRGDGRALALKCRVASMDALGAFVRVAERSECYGSVRVRRERQVDRASVERASMEAGAGPKGPFARVGLDTHRGRLRAAARYQFEAWRDRPGMLDLEAASESPGAAARIRWRSWSGPAVPRSISASASPEDDGRAELDFARGAGRGGAGAWAFRAGSRPRQADGSGGERYVVGDLVVARERGRSLRLTAGRRDAQREGAWRRGRAVGAVIDLRLRGAPGAPRGDLRGDPGDSDDPGQSRGSNEWGAVTLTLESVRADRGTGAYGPGLDVAESGSLRARTRSGVRIGARGWVRLGAWRLGAAVDDEDDGTAVDETTTRAARAPRVNLWLAWSGGTGAP